MNNTNANTPADNTVLARTTMTKKKKAFIIALAAASILLAILMIVFIAYVNSYSRADTDAIEEFQSTYLSKPISVEEDKSGNITVKPEGTVPTTALIFYPGGKVECAAYIPLMQKCAESGMLCIIAKMPCNLAFIDTGAAKSIKEAHPEITSWYIGGHSLGGVAASSYLKKHTDEFDGLVLLGSYSTKDLSDSDLKAITIRGTNDTVVSLDDHNENLKNLPDGYREVFIEGGCHAYFGMYGEQKEDGTPTVTPAEQIVQAAYLITNFVFEDNN